MEPIINSQLPEFKVQAFHNGEFKTVSNEDVKGKWAIFFFYPADFTFVCPTELVDVAEKYEQFKAMGVEVYSVSTDSHFVHKAWHDASESIRKIKYPMLADPTGVLSRAFGVMIEEDGMAYRGTFVVNPEGKIKIAEIHDNNIGRNPEEVLRVLAALKTGGLCAAGWKAGEENLRPDISEREAPVLAGTAPVRIYTMPGCSYCRSVKEFLRQGGISYEEINLAEDKAGQAFMESRGYTGLPVTVIGAEEIVGYNMPRIKAALGLSGANEVK